MRIDWIDRTDRTNRIDRIGKIKQIGQIGTEPPNSRSPEPSRTSIPGCEVRKKGQQGGKKGGAVQGQEKEVARFEKRGGEARLEKRVFQGVKKRVRL